MSRLAEQPQAIGALAFLGPWWQRSSQSLLLGLHLEQEQVRRLTWASTDLADCDSRCVVVVELEDGVDAGRLLSAAESIDLGANLVAHRLRDGRWPHPLLAVDAHTIVTGSKEALRQLVDRGGDAALTSGPMGSLLTKFSPGGDLAVILDLAAADCGMEVPGQSARCLAGWQSELAPALRDAAGPGTFRSIGRPAAMRTGLGLQGGNDGRKDPLGRGKAGARRNPGIARAYRRVAGPAPAQQVFRRRGRSLQAASGQLAHRHALRPLRYRRERRLAPFWLGRAGVPCLGGHGHRQFAGDPGRLVGRSPGRR